MRGVKLKVDFETLEPYPDGLICQSGQANDPWEPRNKLYH